MPPIPYADNFLAGSLVSLLLPAGLVVVIVVWYVLERKRVPEDTPTSSASLPAPEVLAAAADADPTAPGTGAGDA